ncbi:restriction endonuclease subunit S [Streptococcus sp. Z554]
MTPQQLKNAILQQAIQGKLVEQRAEEYVSTELFNAKKNIDMNVPEFEIPNNWKLSTIEGVSKVISTKKYQIRESETLKDGLYPVISQSKEAVIGYFNDTNKLLVIKKPVIIFGDHTTVVKYIDFNFVVGADGIKIFEPIDDIEPKFLKYSIDFLSIGLEKKGGYSRHYKFIKNLSLPVPPLAEQKRIVEKIEELLPLVERYEKAWTRLEELNKKFPLDMQKAILGQAIQGKLVDQRAEEGTGQELYKAIQDEKEKLIEEGKLKKQKALPNITEDEIPFEIPDTWKWVRLGEISKSVQYGYNAPAKNKGRIKMVRISDIQGDSVCWDTVPYCDIREEEIEQYLLKNNDILFARTGGTVGKSFLVKNIREKAIYAGYLIRTQYGKNIVPQFLKYFMGSELYWAQLRTGTIATAQPNCNGQTLSKMILPLPPLAEQQRIVEKIEELLPLVEKLK